MRNRRLHTALLAFAEEAAWQLASDVAEGSVVGFEVVETGGRRDTPLYCYRPLTGDFIEQRTSILGRLPAYLPAVHALGEAGGFDRRRAEEALRDLLARTFEDSTDFVLVPERFDAAYAELEKVVMEGRLLTEVVVPVLGLALASGELALGDGLLLVRGDHDPDLPVDAVRERADGRVPVVARLAWEAAAGDEAPLRHAAVRLRRVLVALRLFDAARVALAPTAWTRTGGGDWTPVAFGGGHTETRGVLVVPPQQEDELRAFVSLISRRTPRAGELAWALRRFELAAERPRPSEGLTDVLLALRALLEPEGPQSGRLPGRVAALCAVEERRVATAERVAHAAALERSVVAGVGPDDEAIDPIVDELTGWLRALLRDVLCGHLDSDLRTVADELLATA